MKLKTPLRLATLSLLLLGDAFGATRAAEPQGDADGILVACDDPTLIGQRRAGEISGQANFHQAYAARHRMMALVQRACRRDGVTHVRLMAEAPERAALAVVHSDGDR